MSIEVRCYFVFIPCVDIKYRLLRNKAMGSGGEGVPEREKGRERGEKDEEEEEEYEEH